MVAVAAGHGGGARRVRGLRHLGGFRQPGLLRRPVPVAVLLAVPGRQLPGADLGDRRQLVAALPRPAGPAVPARVPADLLLLPQGVLPVVLVGATGLRRPRRPAPLHRRDPLPPDPPEHPPLLLLPGAAVPDHPGLGRAAGLPLPRRLGDRPRDRDPARQRGVPGPLHAVVPLLPAPVWG